MPAAALKIALASIEYPPDGFGAGIGSYTRTLAHALSGRGHRVFVVSRGGERDSSERDGPVTVIRLGPPRPVLPETFGPLDLVRLGARALLAEFRYRRRIAAGLEHLVRTEAIDLVEVADHAAEAIGYPVGRYPEVPFVVRLHTPLAVGERFDRNLPEIARRFAAAYERRLLDRATHLTAPSRRGAEVICRHMGVDVERVAVFPNPPSFEIPALLPASRDDGRTVLFVGRITRWKGVHLLVEALPAVLERVPEARFAFVGPDMTSPQGGGSTREHLLQRLPRRFHAAVTFTGRIQHAEVVEHFERAAVCAVPSLFDNFPYVCLEAMSFGKAIVASDQGGMHEMLDAGRCGLLFTPPDSAALGRHIVALLEDGLLRERFGARAHERVLRHYSTGVVMDRVEEFYRGAIAERTGGTVGPGAIAGGRSRT